MSHEASEWRELIAWIRQDRQRTARALLLLSGPIIGLAVIITCVVLVTMYVDW